MDPKAVPSLSSWRKFLFRLLCLCSDALAKLGFKRIAAIGNAIGWLIWRFVPKRRAMAIKNLELGLGMTPQQAEEVAQKSFAHSGRAFAEIILTHDFGLGNPRLSFARPDLWQALISTNRPAVAATAHFGAWELMSPLLGHMHWPAQPEAAQAAEQERPLLVVVRRYDNPVVQAFIARQRQATGGTMVGHRRVAGEVLRALRHNGVAAFLVDHKPLPDEAIRLPFLGRETGVNLGPALLAVRAEAIIWPAFLRREGTNYVFEQQEPLDTRTLQGSRDEKIHQAALFYTQAVENMIRACPEQWFWLHNRWKERP